MLMMTLWGICQRGSPESLRSQAEGHCQASNPDVNMPWSSTTLSNALWWKHLEWVYYSS